MEFCPERQMFRNDLNIFSNEKQKKKWSRNGNKTFNEKINAQKEKPEELWKRSFGVALL